MITVQVHHILKNPTQEKLIDLIESENINNLPPKFNTEQKFKKLKLWATDIDFKYNYNENVINGRIIDFGSIKQLH